MDKRRRSVHRSSAVWSVATALTAAVLTASLPLAAQQAPEALAFKNVTVIDLVDGGLLPAQTVVIVGNRVRTIGATRKVGVPAGAQVVEAKGKYLIPGLWDMHAHTEYSTSGNIALQDSLYRKWYPVYIAHGVTGLREIAQRFPHGADSFRTWQHQVMAGTRVGPRAIGPSADFSYQPRIRVPEDVARFMDSLKAAGDAFIKFHDFGEERKLKGVGRNQLYFSILREARRVGLPVVGHVPDSVPTVVAADSGHFSIEHLNESHQCQPVPEDSLAAEEQCAAVAQAYIRNGTWFTPTIVIFDYILHHHAERESRLRAFQRFVRLLYRLGVTTFLAGTDCGMEVLRKAKHMDPVCSRGVSVLQEVVLLNEWGLSPLAALQAATLNPAKSFNATDSLGTVAVGKLADLVLLDANPLADIRNVATIRAVVANGRYFDRAALDALDPEGVELAKTLAERPPILARPNSATPTTSIPLAPMTAPTPAP